MQNETHTALNRNSIASFFIASLKGISQVVLIENTITGILILVAITTSSLQLGVITLLSAFVGTLIGILGGADGKIISQGLFGYNSVLTGIALTLFLTGPYQWVIALVGAAIAAVLTAAMMHSMRYTEIPILTFPFILSTWLILLATYKLKVIQLTPDLVPQDLERWHLDITGKIDWAEGMFNGIGQIFFLQNTLSGIILFLAVLWASWRFWLYAIVGNLVALLTAYALGAEHSLIYMGLYGYNAILTVFAVSLYFNPSNRLSTKVLGLIGAGLSVPLTASISTILLPFGLPALTIPFVLCTWFLLAAKKILPRF